MRPFSGTLKTGNLMCIQSILPIFRRTRSLRYRKKCGPERTKHLKEKVSSLDITSRIRIRTPLILWCDQVEVCATQAILFPLTDCSPAGKSAGKLNPLTYGRFYRPITHGVGRYTTPPPMTHIEKQYQTISLYTQRLSLNMF